MRRRKGIKAQNHHISVVLPSELYAQLRTACEIQHHGDGQMVRILLEWSLPLYIEIRSIEGIFKFSMECMAKRQKRELEGGVE